MFQIRDGSRVKNPTATATWPDTEEKENRLKYSYKLKTKVNKKIEVSNGERLTKNTVR